MNQLRGLADVRVDLEEPFHLVDSQLAIGWQVDLLDVGIEPQNAINQRDPSYKIERIDVAHAIQLEDGLRASRSPVFVHDDDVI